MTRYRREQIVTVLRQIEVVVANGRPRHSAARDRNHRADLLLEYGGLKLDQAKRLKELEKQNTRLERLVGVAVVGEANSEGCHRGKLASPSDVAIRHARETYRVFGTVRLPAAGAVEKNATLRTLRDKCLFTFGVEVMWQK